MTSHSTELKRVLVATDFSPQADVALSRAVGIAKVVGATLEGAHATGTPPSFAAGPEALTASQARLAEMQELRKTGAEKALAALLAKLEPELPGRVTGRLLPGPPTRVLPARAVEIGADLLVTGARGRGGDQMFIIGSVAEGLVRRATTNVLVVRGDEKNEGYRHILIATDLTEASEAAIPTSLLCAAPDADVELMHVVDWGLTGPEFEGASGSPMPDFEDLWQEAIQEARTELEGFLARARGSRASLRHRVVVGVAAAEILRHLKKAGPDLLVVGKHLRELPMHESVAERLVRHAPTSVLVARSPRA